MNSEQLQEDVFLLNDKLKAKEYDEAEQILSRYDDANDLLNHRFDDWQLPLAIAARNTQDGTEVDWLISRGADVNGRHNSPYGALSIAIEEGNVIGIAKLLQYGAEVNQSDLYKDSPLCIAIDARTMEGASSDKFNPAFQEIVRLLLQYGADPNSKDWVWSGKTALYKAVQHFWQFCLAGDLIPILLEAGADPLMPDSSGVTPLDVAKRNKDSQSISLLMEAIARNA